MKNIKRTAALMTAIGTIFSENVFANTINLPNVKNEMAFAQYWIQKIDNPNRQILSLEQIENINDSIFNDDKTKCVNLKDYSETVNEKQLVEQLSNFNITDTHFIDGQKVSYDYYETIRQNILLLEPNPEKDVQYGFVTHRTNIKIYPTDDILNTNPDDLEWDNFQDSAALVNEPVIILTNTNDKRWYYILTYFCRGWVLAEDIAVCKNKDEWLEFQNYTDFIVVTADEINLESNLYSKEISEILLTMGTILPLADMNDLTLDGRSIYGNYIVYIPVRDADGFFVKKAVAIPSSRDVHIGFLDYNYENLINQIFKSYGTLYGWGGMLNSRDCSAYVMEVLRCFGFKLPRNTSSQAAMPVTRFDLSKYSQNEKLEFIKTLNPCTILQFKGHTMFYLGTENNLCYVISAVSSMNLDKLTNLRTVLINDLNAVRPNGRTWINDLDLAIVLE